MTKACLKTFENYLVWSDQRTRTFYECPRKYGHQYVESWKGWEPDAPASRRYSYYLKNVLPDLRLVTGSIVHDRCGRILKRLVTGLKSNLADEISVAEADFDLFMARSLVSPLESLSSKRKKLLTHLYGDEIPPAWVRSERDSIKPMLTTFFALPEMKLFAAHPELVRAEFIEAALGDPTHELGVPARLITDAVYQKEGATWVLDWKTGAEQDSHREKALIYDIFIRERLKLAPTDSVRIRFYYLKSGGYVDFDFSPEERDETRWLVGEAFELLRSQSRDSVINIAPLGSFRAQVGPHCLRCPFQVICNEFSRELSKGTLDRWVK